MSFQFQIHDHCSRSEKIDLEGGGVRTPVEDGGFLHACYPYLFERGLRTSWKLFGCCALVGLTNVVSTLFTLAVTTDLQSTDIILESNALLLSTGGFVSLFCRLHVLRSVREHCRARNELSSRVRSCMVGCFLTVMLSPSLACLPLLAIRWFWECGVTLHDAPGVPLILSWIWINALAALLIPSLIARPGIYERGDPTESCAFLHKEAGDYDAYENVGEANSPQHPISAYYNTLGGPLSDELGAAYTVTPRVSWENTIETPDALRELVCWAVSVPAETLQPSVTAELLAMAAISIGVSLDGMDDLTQDTPYTYLISRTCDRLAEIFQQADQVSFIPEQAVNVFLFVHRLEQFDGVDIERILGPGNDCIPAGELRRIVRCLKSRSASLLGC